MARVRKIRPIEKPNLIIKFEEGEATPEEVIQACTQVLMAIAEWDFTEPEKTPA